MGRVADFKALGEFAMLPAARLGDMVASALADAAFYEAEYKKYGHASDLENAEDLLDWALFLDKWRL